MSGISITRRTVVTTITGAVTTQLLGCGLRDDDAYSMVESSIGETLSSGNTPGIACCVVRGDRVEWSAGYAWADIPRRKPMSPGTIQNIASVSKTITATAIMQLWEQGKLRLDDDVNEHVPFPVRNPRFSSTPITIRQLLTHTSSIADGPAYEPSYGCGDPTMSLLDWLFAYFDPTGINYDAEQNFLAWRPGTLDFPLQDTYSNLAFGLLGGIVETISGMSFANYTQQNIFDPLSMNDTGWYLTDIDESRHAIPYGAEPDPRLSGRTDQDAASADSDYHPYCLYSFSNYPDGLIRTSVNDLSRFLRAYIGLGSFDSARILNASTIETMLAISHDRQGLCWRSPPHLSGDDTIRGHGGGDPGVSTTMDFSPRREFGVIVFSNFDGWNLVREVSRELFTTAAAI